MGLFYDWFCKKEVEKAIDEAVSEVLEVIDDLGKRVSDLEIPEIDDEIEDEDEVIESFVNFRTLPQEEWPRKVGGARVGYVRVGAEKSPLVVPDMGGVLNAYESDELRSGTTTSAKRVLVKSPTWLMVFANGEAYEGVPNKRVRPFGFDGGTMAYLVMHEQIVDGIFLKELPGNKHVELHVWFQDIVDVYEPTSVIEW